MSDALELSLLCISLRDFQNYLQNCYYKKLAFDDSSEYVRECVVAESLNSLILNLTMAEA